MFEHLNFKLRFVLLYLFSEWCDQQTNKVMKTLFHYIDLIHSTMSDNLKSERNKQKLLAMKC